MTTDFTVSIPISAYKEMYTNGLIILKKDNYPFDSTVFEEHNPIMKVQVFDENKEELDIKGWKLFEVLSVTSTKVKNLENLLYKRKALVLTPKGEPSNNLTMDSVMFLLQITPINNKLKDFNLLYGKSKSA